MPQIRSNIKSYQITLRNRYYNKKYKLAIKIAIKEYLIKIKKNSLKIKEEGSIHNYLSLVYQKIDKAVKKNILHKNTASHKKAKLAQMIKKNYKA
uniref:Ribosomal protein S20 n=1 Tax=Harveyella mirabilis TaxID=282355 RepID=A0A3S8UW09_9FLOR|nr:ribosomal protein S20 [Harveyella mirabilis]